MSENNHIDDLMKSILESGQEEVPERVWEGVCAGLDKISGRKAAVIWFRRTGIAAAAAAAVTVGFLLNRGDDSTQFVPASEGEHMIAVAETVHEDNNALALNDVSTAAKTYMLPAVTDEDECEGIQEDMAVTEEKPSADHKPADDGKHGDMQESKEHTQPRKNVIEESGDWQENETGLKERRKINTSLTLSGLAGTNSPQNKGKTGPMKSPAKEFRYTETTVKQTSTQTTYGIPVSVGAGVRIGFSDRWSLSAGVNYTLLTSKFNGKYIKVDEDGTENTAVYANIRNLQHYVGIPLNVHYNIVSRSFVNFYASAGGTVEKCVLNRYEIQSVPSINHDQKVKGMQLSVNAGIGVEFMIGKHIGLYVDPSLRYYFRSSQPSSIRTAQPLMLGFEMGMRVNI